MIPHKIVHDQTPYVNMETISKQDHLVLSSVEKNTPSHNNTHIDKAALALYQTELMVWDGNCQVRWTDVLHIIYLKTNPVSSTDCSVQQHWKHESPAISGPCEWRKNLNDW